MAQWKGPPRARWKIRITWQLIMRIPYNQNYVLPLPTKTEREHFCAIFEPPLLLRLRGNIAGENTQLTIGRVATLWLFFVSSSPIRNGEQPRYRCPIRSGMMEWDALHSLGMTGKVSVGAEEAPFKTRGHPRPRKRVGRLRSVASNRLGPEKAERSECFAGRFWMVFRSAVGQIPLTHNKTINKSKGANGLHGFSSKALAARVLHPFAL